MTADIAARIVVEADAPREEWMAEHEGVTFARQMGSPYSEQRIRSAVPELARKGWLERLDVFKPGPSHTRRAHVWRLTP